MLNLSPNSAFAQRMEQREEERKKQKQYVKGPAAEAAFKAWAMA